MLKSLGKVTVAAAGTPVRATTNESDPAEQMTCHALMIEALWTNTGKVYIGEESMNKTTLAGVVAILAAPTANTLPTFSATISFAVNPLDFSQVWIDVDTNGEGVLCSAIEA